MNKSVNFFEDVTQHFNMYQHFLISIFGMLFCFAGFSQSKDTSILVFGEGFSFSVQQPKGWTGDTEFAKSYNANIIFYESKAELENDGALIQVLAFTKQDENTINDLQVDINSYKKKYPRLKMQRLVVKHDNYKRYSKLVSLDKIFYKYITYINPGKKYKHGLSVAMKISRSAANRFVLNSYLKIIASVIMLGK